MQEVRDQGKMKGLNKSNKKIRKKMVSFQFFCFNQITGDLIGIRLFSIFNSKRAMWTLVREWDMGTLPCGQFIEEVCLQQQK